MSFQFYFLIVFRCIHVLPLLQTCTCSFSLIFLSLFSQTFPYTNPYTTSFGHQALIMCCFSFSVSSGGAGCCCRTMCRFSHEPWVRKTKTALTMLGRYTAAEVRGLVSDANARLVVTDEASVDKARDACQGLHVEFVVNNHLLSCWLED